MKTKICGINSWENAEIAIDCGASAVGFLVGTTHLAEDKIDLESAKEIINRLPPFISSVAVTHLQDTSEIIKMCRYLGVNALQIHDYISPEEVLVCKKALPFTKILKAVHVTDGEREKALETAASFENVADAIILDSRTADRIGGTGITHDWSISREIVEKIKKPVILAGGLTPENVYEAVKTVRPFGVDVNSGVEINGNKDREKVFNFIMNAKKSDLDLKKEFAL